MAELHTIHVFPNSGHHYTFIPFPDELVRSVPKLQRLCKGQRMPWGELGERGERWIRGRYGVDKNGVPGIWVAVESNLGMIQRGSLHGAKRQVPDSDLPEDKEDWKRSPYAFEDVTKLPDDTEARPFVIEIPHPDNPDQKIEVANFKVIWKVPAGEPIDVDLVVDFGNTRTVVLALENRQTLGGGLPTICRPVRFIKRGYDYEENQNRSQDDTSSIVDSWFVLHEPPFADLDPPSLRFQPTREYNVEESVSSGMLGKKKESSAFVTERVPQLFVELSSAVLGDEARDILGTIDLERGGSYTLSSPKRYTWDDQNVGKNGMGYWTMVLNRWNAKAKSEAELPNLCGSMLRFFHGDGRDWDIENPPNESADGVSRPSSQPQNPAFPRKDAMAWVALAILELAYRQITSEEWRKGNLPFIPRRLRSIFVTFPSGWISQEAETYRKMWEKALNIFTLTHLEDSRPISEGGDRPSLSIELDEAVASQLPLVYSEIVRLGNEGENWIELYGRGKDTNARVRLMTIDIGGGTTDISIVEYWDELPGAGVALKYNPIFKDSNSYAGDRLVKAVIESVLLPSFAAAKGIDADSDEGVDFEQVFLSALSKESDKAKWSRIVKLIFLPIVRQWLKDLTHGNYGNPDTGTPWAPVDIEGAEGKLVDLAAWDDLNNFFAEAGFGADFLDLNTPIKYDPDDIVQAVRETFASGLEPLAKYVTAFEVDLISLSGKPSELPQVKELVDEIMPILPQRVISLRDYPAGDWYPMSTNNRVNDAKSVTAVGAALYLAIKNGLIEGWHISEAGNTEEPPRNNWGLMPSDPDACGFGTEHPFLDVSLDESNDVHILVNSCIGRQRFSSKLSRPEQQYKLVWADPDSKRGSMPLKVKFRRQLDPSDRTEVGLEIVDCQALNSDEEITLAELKLQLCTLEGGEFWIDSGRFEVQWD